LNSYSPLRPGDDAEHEPVVEDRGEVGVGVDDADDVLPRADHTSSLPVIGPERACRRADVVAPTREAAAVDELSYRAPACVSAD
jgi:hypothetical protein